MPLMYSKSQSWYLLSKIWAISFDPLSQFINFWRTVRQEINHNKLKTERKKGERKSEAARSLFLLRSSDVWQGSILGFLGQPLLPCYRIFPMDKCGGHCYDLLHMALDRRL